MREIMKRGNLAATDFFTLEELVAIQRDIGGALQFVAVASTQDSRSNPKPIAIEFEEVKGHFKFEVYVRKRSDTGAFMW